MHTHGSRRPRKTIYKLQDGGKVFLGPDGGRNVLPSRFSHKTKVPEIFIIGAEMRANSNNSTYITTAVKVNLSVDDLCDASARYFAINFRIRRETSRERCGLLLK